MVDLFQREELALAQSGQNPALYHQHARLHLGLVAGLSPSGRDHRHIIVRGHLFVGPVEVWFVAAGAGHAGLQVVRHQDFRHCSEELKDAQVRSDPVGQTLRPGRLRKAVAAGAQDRHKDGRCPPFSRRGIVDHDRIAGIVDE